MDNRQTVADFDDLFRFNYRPLCLYAMHYLGDVNMVEDIVQECFMSLWTRIAEGHGVSDRKPYLYASVRNRCLDHVRKCRNGMVQLDVADVKTSPELACMLEDEDLEKSAEVEARLWTAIDSLPERCREILLLNKRDGMKYDEIARHLNLSRNTVRNQISKALRLLKDGAVKLYMFFFA